MKIVGIVAEFNPFHNGHKYLIDKAKEITNSDIAICIMSGNFTQAGNVSLIDKFKRAEIAVKNGFDVVIELPTIYATSSSQFFAYGAINLLNKLNCIDYLCFGSETANTDELINISKKLIDNNETIWSNISNKLKDGISFAKAREFAISDILTKDELKVATYSNNILAIEYIKNLIMLHSKIEPIAIKREENDNITSATNIRNILKESKNVDEVEKYIPYSNEIFENSLFNDDLFNILKYIIVSRGKGYIRTIREVTEGLENKIYDEINNSNNYHEFIHNVKSKRYQLSKIKRIMLYIILDINKRDFIYLNNEKNSYAHILAINPNNKDKILSLLNKTSNMKIITSLNDDIISKQDLKIRESITLDIKASNIFSVLSNNNINKDYTNKL